MSGQGGMTRNSRVIRASPGDLYAAFVDPEALVEWLPPGGMTGEMHSFDGRVGGGYAMSLYYPDEDDREHPGKTAEREDRVEVRFMALEPGRKIVEAVTFASDDPALAGETTMTITFTPAAGGTEVMLLFENLPPGIPPADNELGAELSLAQLAEYVQG